MPPSWVSAKVKADEVRAVHAALRRELRDMGREEGCATVAAWLRANEPRIDALKTLRLLTAIRSFKDFRALALVNRAEVRPEARVRDLTDVERGRLADLLAPPTGEPLRIPTPKKTRPPKRKAKPKLAPTLSPKVPAGPFLEWARAKYATPTEAAEFLRIPKQPLADAWNGRTDVVSLDHVDRALADHWETIDDLYPLDQAA